MSRKILGVVWITVLLLGTVFSTAVQAQTGEGGGNAQSPVQVLVQIFVTAAVLRFLQKYDLP